MFSKIIFLSGFSNVFSLKNNKSHIIKHKTKYEKKIKNKKNVKIKIK